MARTTKSAVEEVVTNAAEEMNDKNEKKVFSGGSGCACSMCVSMTKLLDNVEKGIYKRLLVVATGALFSAMAVQQKESIPCIVHAIEYEWSDLK